MDLKDLVNLKDILTKTEMLCIELKMVDQITPLYDYNVLDEVYVIRDRLEIMCINLRHKIIEKEKGLED